MVSVILPRETPLLLSSCNVCLVILTSKITSFDQNTPSRISSIFSDSFSDEGEFCFFVDFFLMTFDPANTERCVTVLRLELWQCPINLPCDLLSQKTDHFFRFNNVYSSLWPTQGLCLDILGPRFDNLLAKYSSQELVETERDKEKEY